MTIIHGSAASTAMDLNAQVRHEMALRSFGYGRWEAPFWFIGPEQGAAKNEDPNHRTRAWQELGRNDLDDCWEFHKQVKIERWHGAVNGNIGIKKPALQATWKSLMLTLPAFCQEPHDIENRRSYQMSSWGRSFGETCVIELSGIAAHSHREMLNGPDCFVERMTYLIDKMNRHSPRFVILYGKGRNGNSDKAWKALAADSQFVGSTRLSKIALSGATLLARTLHPQARGLTSRDWIDLGLELSNLAVIHGIVG